MTVGLIAEPVDSCRTGDSENYGLTRDCRSLRFRQPGDG